MPETFESHLDPDQRDLLAGLDSPVAIQAFLDQITYPATDANRCPVSVLRDRTGHCLDGALFAAAALRRLGDPPRVVDLLPEPGMDDDHVIAIYKRDGCYGALAKSNYVGLRFREPVYKTLRELAMSYFELFFNMHGQKTLRAYSRPLNLQTMDRTGWMWQDAGADAVEQRLYSLRRIPLLTDRQFASLAPVDERAYQAGLLGANLAGLYAPKGSGKG